MAASLVISPQADEQGLGLYIADRIVAGYGGRIVYSYADRRVTFTIPLAG